MIELFVRFGGYIVIACLALYLIRMYLDGKREEAEESLIEALNIITNELEAGNAIETALVTISKDPQNPSAKYFQQILEEVKKGKSFTDSLEFVSKNTKSETFAYICKIIHLAQESKGNIANSLRKLAKNLWEINHLQTSIVTKASGALSKLKIMGIIILPLIYYLMSSVASSPGNLVEISLPFQIYFFIVAIGITFSNYFLFADWKDGLYLFPFSVSYIGFSIVTIGPYIANIL